MKTLALVVALAAPVDPDPHDVLPFEPRWPERAHAAPRYLALLPRVTLRLTRRATTEFMPAEGASDPMPLGLSGTVTLTFGGGASP